MAHLLPLVRQMFYKTSLYVFCLIFFHLMNIATPCYGNRSPPINPSTGSDQILKRGSSGGSSGAGMVPTNGNANGNENLAHRSEKRENCANWLAGAPPKCLKTLSVPDFLHPSSEKMNWDVSVTKVIACAHAPLRTAPLPAQAIRRDSIG